MINYSDQPEQSYYSACKVRLILRFEEFSPTELASKPPAKTTKNLKGVSVPRDDLTVETETDSAGRRRLVLRGKTARINAGAPAPTASVDDISTLTFTVPGVVPISANLRMVSRTADTFNCDFLFADCPFDPRCIRAAAVEVFMGTIDAQDAAAGNEGLQRAAAPGVNVSRLQCPDTFVVPDTGEVASTRVFAGWVDKWSIAFQDDLAVCKIACRDNFTLLDAQKAPPNLRLDPKIPIDEAVAKYLAHFPQMEGLSVLHLPADEVPPKLEASLAKGSFPPHLGPAPSGGGGATGGDSTSVIEYLTNALGSLGYNVRIELDSVILQQASGLVSGKKSPRGDDPYRGRSLPSGERAEARQMIFGGNVETMTIDRDFAHADAKNVEVRCYNPARKSVVVARYPGPKDRVVSAKPGGKEEHEWHVVRLPAGSCTDQALLAKAAKSIYENKNRMQLVATVKTPALASWGGDNRFPDLLYVRPGDLFELRNEAFALDALLQNNGALVDYMTNLGYSLELAQAYEAARSNVAVQRFFALREANIVWGVDTGLEVSLQLATYVEARIDVDDPSRK